MHFCKAKIAIGGDSRNIFVATEYAPVSWPEVMVLQQVHGDGAVDEVEPFVSIDQSPREEKRRLAEKYTEEIVDAVFGGRQGVPNEMEAPRVKLASNITWFNPITREVETVNGGGGREKTELDDEVFLAGKKR